MAFNRKKYVPIGLSFFLDKIIAIISNPPVDAPHFRVIPTPTATITPPKTALSNKSFDKTFHRKYF